MSVSSVPRLAGIPADEGHARGSQRHTRLTVPDVARIATLTVRWAP